MVKVGALTGFLGAGKTTTLKHVLENCAEGVRVGVIANDVAQVNIDIELVRDVVKEEGSGTVRSVQLQNGCACCTASGDLVESFEGLVRDMGEEPFDFIIIEATGVAEAGQMRKVLEDMPSVKNGSVELANVVTVLDGNDFLNQYQSGEMLRQRPDLTGETKEDGGELKRLVVDLLVEQVEGCDQVVLNKMDLIQDDPSKVEALVEIVGKLNEKATVHRTSFGRIDLLSLLRTSNAKETKEDESKHHHAHDHDHKDCTSCCQHHKKREDHKSKYGIESFIFRSERPFVGPLLARNVLQKMAVVQQSWTFPTIEVSDKDIIPSEDENNPFKNVLRSKGFLFLSNQTSRKMYWSHAGKLFSVAPQGMWENSEPMQELVFIGINMDKDAIMKLLQDSLE